MGGRLPYIREEDMTPAEFSARFLLPNRPCMVTGCAETWRAGSRWSSSAAFCEFYGHVELRVTEVQQAAHPFQEPQCRAVRVPMRHYVPYARQNCADYPWCAINVRLHACKMRIMCVCMCVCVCVHVFVCVCACVCVHVHVCVCVASMYVSRVRAQVRLRRRLQRNTSRAAPRFCAAALLSRRLLLCGAASPRQRFPEKHLFRSRRRALWHCDAR